MISLTCICLDFHLKYIFHKTTVQTRQAFLWLKVQVLNRHVLVVQCLCFMYGYKRYYNNSTINNLQLSFLQITIKFNWFLIGKGVAK